MQRHTILATLFSLAATTVAAHAPVVNDDGAAYDLDAPYVIDDPEHSKAIFSVLKGDPQYFRIDAEEDFRFYAGITQPKLEGCDLFQTFSFDVLDADLNRIDGRDGSDFEWWPWFEEYGEQWYWVGPEIGEDFKGNRTYEAGTYYIRVYNADNTGHYAMAVGDIERFGFTTIAGMVLNRTMSKIEDGWWDESLCP